MNYTDEEIINLQNDESFLKELEEKEKKAIENKDIINLYDVLDTLLLFKNENKERINKLYSLIIEEAFINLHNKLKSEDMFNLNVEIEHYSLRAIYEYAIEQYSGGKLHEAKEIFIMLSILTDNNVFKGAMQIHLIAILKNIPFEDFISQFVDMEKMESANESFFILYFFDTANKFLHENAHLIKEAVTEVKNSKI
jgi:hypothetical protein